MAQPLEQPQPQPQKAFPVSWDQFHRDARALAWRLAGAGPFQAIVAITRGGLVPAAVVARELEKPMAPAFSASFTVAAMRAMSSSVAASASARLPMTYMRSAEWPIYMP